MRVSITVCYLLGGATLALAGCSGSAQQVLSHTTNSGLAQHSLLGSNLHLTVARSGAVSVLPAGLTIRTRHLRPSARVGPDKVPKGYTYVGQFSGPTVQEYYKNNKANNPPQCTVPGQSVNGIAVDPSGNLWVPNGTGGGQGYTQEYAPNCGAAKLNISDPNGQPADVGFDSKGNIYILNIFDANGNAGTVNIYDSGGSLIGSLSDPSFNELIGIGTDGNDNVFVSNRDVNGIANVVEFPAGTMPGTVLSGITLGLPGAPTFDSANDLIITDWQAYTLNVYAPPYMGSPTTTPMQGLSLWCALGRLERRLYCADLGGSVDAYAYPSGAYLYSYTNGLIPSGFATGIGNDPPAAL
ncbi:MAG: hypothetical protein ABI346_08145 [Candidatus Baltobacteraceae bacterium]